MANMAIEAGAKNGIFAVDEVTRAYVEGRVNRPWEAFDADPDAEYTRVIELNLSEIDCTVAFPHLPENAHLAAESGDITIDQVVIGSCTNGQFADMEAAARILKGRKIAKGIRAIVIPATQAVYMECIRQGWMETFVEAGCVVSTPTCLRTPIWLPSPATSPLIRWSSVPAPTASSPIWKPPQRF